MDTWLESILVDSNMLMEFLEKLLPLSVVSADDDPVAGFRERNHFKILTSIVNFDKLIEKLRLIEDKNDIKDEHRELIDILKKEDLFRKQNVSHANSNES